MPIAMINIVFKRDFKLYECDDCSECPLKHQCIKYKLQIKTKPSTVKKVDVEPVFGFIKAILDFTRMSVRGIKRQKRTRICADGT